MSRRSTSPTVRVDRRSATLAPIAVDASRSRPAEHEAETAAHAITRADAKQGPVMPLAPGRWRRPPDSARLTGGAPLPSTAVARSFGVDLSAVRLHVDDASSRAAAALGVEAFTIDNHIAFAPGRFRPDTARGRHVLAHELAHVAAPVPLTGIHAFEGWEHRYAGDQGPRDLLAFLATDEGKAWARQLGYDPAQLLRDLSADPFVQNAGRRIAAGSGQGQTRASESPLHLSPGEAISLSGDIFAPEQLGSTPPGEVRRVLDIFDLQEHGELRGPAGDAALERVTRGEYTARAKDNRPHFASTGPVVAGFGGSKDNRSEWKRLHARALTAARVAASLPTEAARNGALDEAYLLDAAGGHFLTDAFSGGHLIDPVRVEAEAINYLRAHPVDTSANPEGSIVVGGLSMAGVLPKLVLKNLHDRLNREGYVVTNAKGLSWRAFGDGRLQPDSQSMRVMSLAVLLSRRQVANAFSGASTADDPQAVLDLLPDAHTVEQATAYAIRMIPSAVSEVMPLISRNVDLLGAGSMRGLALARPWLRTIMSPDRSRQLEESRQRGTIAPQLTWTFP